MRPDEYEAVRLFADSITPRNWNVVLSPGDYRYIPYTLNIWLQILGEKEAMEWFALEGPFMGRVWGPMWYTRLSSIKDRIPEAMEALEEYGDGSVARVHIQLCPHMADWRFIVVHELAHVAATRCKARKIRPFRSDNVFVAHDRKDDRHGGPLFRRALLRMISRTEARFGKSPATEEMWDSYQQYIAGCGRDVD